MNRTVVLLAASVAVLGAAVYVVFDGNEEAAASGAPLATVTMPVLSSAEKLGEAAFNKNCAVCHGVNAAGQDGIAPPLVHRIYEPSHHGDQSFVLAAQRGVRQHHWPFGDMPAVEGITNSEIESIIVYVRGLQRANGIN